MTNFYYKFTFLIVVLIGLLYSCTQKKSMINSSNNTQEKYTLIWEDTFENEELDLKKWNRQVEPAGRFNAEWQRYTNDKKNAFIRDNQLVIKAIHESKTHGLNQYSSARLNTAGKFDFTYGKIVAKIKLPSGKAIWPAFWMLGSNIDENGGDTIGQGDEIVDELDGDTSLENVISVSIPSDVDDALEIDKIVEDFKQQIQMGGTKCE